MPDQNYGMAYLQPMEAMQRMDQQAQLHPLEVLHKQALTRLDQAQAGAMELSQQMQQSGLKALEGFQFDKSSPSKSLLEMGARLAPSQPVLAEKMIAAAATAMQREGQAEAAKVLAGERQAKLARAKTEAILGAYRGLSSTDPASLARARDLATLQGGMAEMPPEELRDAIEHVEGILKSGGPLAIESLIRQTATAHDLIQVDLKKQQLKLKEKEEADREAHRRETERLGREREARQAAKGTADGKAGKGPAPKLSQGEFAKDAKAEIARDALLMRGNAADKLGWERDIAGKVLEKIEASVRERQSNPNIPIKPREQALREAVSEVKGLVKQDSGVMGRLMSALGKDVEGTPTRMPTKELPSDLKNFKPEEGVIYTRGGVKYKYDSARHGLAKVE